MRWRVLVWVGVLIAAVAVVMLGVVVVTEGLAAASGLAGVIVGFCELVGATLAVIGWAGEHRPAADAVTEETSPSAGSAGQHAPGRGSACGGKYAVTVGDNAQGVVIGNGNVLNIDLRYPGTEGSEPGAGESG